MTDQPGATEQPAPGRKQKEASLIPQDTKRGSVQRQRPAKLYNEAPTAGAEHTPTKGQGKNCKAAPHTSRKGSDRRGKADDGAHIGAHNAKGAE